MTILQPITPLELREVAHCSIGSDPLSLLSLRHNGSLHRVDENGHSAALIEKRSSAGDMKFFESLARIANGTKELRAHLSSQRVYVPKPNDTKDRAIDIPSQVARLVAICLRQQLTTHMQRVSDQGHYLSDAIIAFRPMMDFPDHAGSVMGATIQDVFADRVYRLQTKRPWVVSIDESDAFGQLPHKAIHLALKELGLNKVERRRILEVVRIRTVYKGEVLTGKPGFGIEQGNPLSPLIFNLVHSHIAKQLDDVGVPSAFFGDDIQLFATNSQAANEAFKVFKRMTADLGFTNIRGLDEGLKPTRIYYTGPQEGFVLHPQGRALNQPVPLIKTFLVDHQGIRLTTEKSDGLKAKIRNEEKAWRSRIHNGMQRPSMSQVRKWCVYRSVSKWFLKAIIEETLQEQPARMSTTTDRYPRILPGDPVTKTVTEEVITLLDNEPNEAQTLDCEYGQSKNPMGGRAGEGVSLPAHPYKEAMSSEPDDSLLFPLESSPQDWRFNTETSSSAAEPNGRGEFPRDPSAAGVTPGVEVTLNNDGERSVLRRSPSQTVLTPPVAILEGLNEGVDANDLCAPLRSALPVVACTAVTTAPPLLLDLTAMAQVVTQRKYQTVAVRALCRAYAVRGRLDVMVNIHDAFVLDSRVLGGADDPRFRCVERTTCFDTGRLRIRLRRRKAKPQRRRKSQTRPTAEATVLKTIVTPDLRSVRVTFEDHGKQRTKTYRTQSLHAPIAKLHATAKAIRHLDARRVAIPASGVASMLVQLNTPRSNKPGLGPALTLLATRTWKRKGDWLIGTLRSPQSTSKL